MLKQLPEFIDFGEYLEVIGREVEKSGQKSREKMQRTYLQQQNYLALVGVIRLEDFARFTSQEEQNNDTIELYNKVRVYLTGLKRRAVYRRISEGIIRAIDPEYPCATPDHQCMNCYNCYAYGGVSTVKGDTKSVRSRFKMTTCYSLQDAEEALAEETEFHSMTHRDLSMAQEGDRKEASIYNLHLIKPNTVFPFIDFIFNPSRFDLSIYVETLRQAQKMGFGSMTSRLATCKIELLGASEDLPFGYKELLQQVMVDASGEITVGSEISARLQELNVENLRQELPSLMEKYKEKILTREEPIKKQ